MASPWPYPTLTVAPRPTAIGASTALASPRAATPDTLPPDQAALLELVIAGLDAAITSQPLPAELSPVVRQQLLALIERQDPYYQRRAWVVDWQPGPLTWTSGPAPGPALAVWHVALTGAVTLVTSDHLAPVVTAFDPSVNDLSVTLARDGDRWTVARVAGALFPTP
ncbi:MAG TPA: hypothetical protein VFU72_05595 [Nitrolancea sp.]|nr:hypothetical protein [Nitrolancea sp.]